MNKEKIFYYLGWIVRILIGALFLFAGISKLIGSAMVVQEFQSIGFGMWFLYFTGVWEILGAVLLLIPSKRHFGALLLLCICIGAFFAQVFFIHMDWIHTIVLGLIISVLLYQDKNKFL